MSLVQSSTLSFENAAPFILELMSCLSSENPSLYLAEYHTDSSFIESMLFW